MTARTPIDTANRVYRGAPGRTRKVQVHYTCPCGTIISTEVYRSIDVSAQPELKQRFRGQNGAPGLNTATCPERTEPIPIEVPVVYHDADHRLFVLVLPESARHRELAERAALLDELADDPSPVPRYVREFSVVFGIDELNEVIRRRDEELAHAQRLAEREQALEHEAQQLADDREEFALRAAELDRIAAELDERSAAAAARAEELDRRAADLDRRERAIDLRATKLREAEEALATGRVTRQGDPDEQGESAETHATTAVDASTIGETSNPFALFDDDDDLAAVSTDSLEQGRVSEVITGIEDLDELDEVDPDELTDQLTDEVAEELDDADLIATSEIITSSDLPSGSRAGSQDVVTLVSEITDVAVERWSLSGEPTLKIASGPGSVRIAVSVGKDQAQALVSDRLDVRIQLHRFPSCPLINMVVGPPQLIDGSERHCDPVNIHFDISIEDRAVLQALERDFTFSFEIYDRDYELIRKRTVTGDLAENVRFVLAAADEHLTRIGDGDRSYAKAEIAFSNPDYDRYGWNHPERSEFRADKLTELTTARKVRRALAIADRFSSPKREVYLFMLRGYPLATWRAQRRDVLAAALNMGIWMGDRLAHVAVSEALARSRKDLVKTLDKNFAAFTSGSDANDLDSDACSDNRAALRKEAESLGIKRGSAKRATGKKRRSPRKTPIQSAIEPVVSGTIKETTSRAIRVSQAARNLSVDDLMARLGDPKKRVKAAVELARRRELRAIEPVMAAAAKMNRTDAVEVLAATASFGDTATPSLVASLGSNKSFIRQGCALALSVLQNEAAIEALSDQLIGEPTALWREIARGLGVVGPAAIMSLASRVTRSEEPAARERVAWALAHIAARGGTKQVKQLAKGRDSVASSVAKHALELIDLAKSDDLQVRGQNTPKEQTVNRAFSRRFFQALEASTPVVDPSVTGVPPDVSAPAMVLDEADLLEATELEEDEAELLDESDLLPT